MYTSRELFKKLIGTRDLAQRLSSQLKKKKTLKVNSKREIDFVVVAGL